MLGLSYKIVEFPLLNAYSYQGSLSSLHYYLSSPK